MKKSIFSILIVLFLQVASFAQAGEFALGLGYPHFLVKYSPFEVKYATIDGINVFAVRLYLNFYQGERVRAFTGAEGGYIKFNTLDIKGNGYEGSVFIGGEYFVTDNIAFAIDLSPTYLGLKSEDNYKANGFEIVGNASLYYYFSAATKRSSTSKKKVIDTYKWKEALIEKFTTKAEQYSDEGKYDKAIAVWQKVLKLDPDDERAREEIERARALMEDMKEGSSPK